MLRIAAQADLDFAKGRARPQYRGAETRTEAGPLGAYPVLWRVCLRSASPRVSGDDRESHVAPSPSGAGGAPTFRSSPRGGSPPRRHCGRTAPDPTSNPPLRTRVPGLKMGTHAY